MKKLLQLMTAITIASGTGITAVACKKDTIENITTPDIDVLKAKLNEVKKEIDDLEVRLKKAKENGDTTANKIKDLQRLIIDKKLIFERLKKDILKFEEITTQYEKDAKKHQDDLDKLIENLKQWKEKDTTQVESFL